MDRSTSFVESSFSRKFLSSCKSTAIHVKHLILTSSFLLNDPSGQAKIYPPFNSCINFLSSHFNWIQYNSFEQIFTQGSLGVGHCYVRMAEKGMVKVPAGTEFTFYKGARC